VQLYDRPVRVLMHEMVKGLGLVPGQIFAKDDALDWFRANFPLIKEGTIAAHLIRLSTNNKNRLHYGVREDGSDDLFFQLDRSHFRLYQPSEDPVPIREGKRPDAIDEKTPSTNGIAGADEFAYEHDLRDYPAKNLHLIEPGLRLYSDEGISGIEFPCGGRFVDILALDSSGNYVVVELKVSRGYDRVVGQLLRYMAWIERHQADAGQRMRGVIIAKEVSEDLQLACASLSGVQLLEYSLSVSVRSVRLGV
jgi:endonuclease